MRLDRPIFTLGRRLDSGDLAVMNILGGSWNEYADVVLQMAIQDTLLSIEERLTDIHDRLSGLD